MIDKGPNLPVERIDESCGGVDASRETGERTGDKDASPLEKQTLKDLDDVFDRKTLKV